MKRIAIHILLISGVFFLSHNSFGQTYEELITQAESAYENKDYQLSGSLYDSAFMFIDDVYGWDYIWAARSFSAIDDIDKSVSYIVKLLESDSYSRGGGNPYYVVATDPDLDYVRNSKKFQNYLESNRTDIKLGDLIDIINNPSIEREMLGPTIVIM